MAEEGLKKTQHNRIHIARPIDINAEAFIKNLSELKEIAETGDKEGLYRKIEEIVPTYSRYSKEEYAVNELEKTAGTLL
jgi:hypothetical protein